MKKIIVPVDFSEQSENALIVAAELAKKHDAEIIALHMLELSEGYISDSESNLNNQLVFFFKLAEKKFTEFLKKDYLKAVKVTPLIKHTKVFSELNEVAKSENVDLIIMGSHGTDGLKEIFVGSNTERVVRNSEIPVLVIKNKQLNFKIDSFVFASSFNVENVGAFKKAEIFAKKLGAEFKLVYINLPGDRFVSTKEAYIRINAFLSVAKAAYEVKIYNDYSVEKGIFNYCETIGASMIGIPTHGRTGISHFFAGSIGEDIANHSPIPVITFKM